MLVICLILLIFIFFYFICLTSAVALLVGEKLQEEATLVVSSRCFQHLTAKL